MRHDNQKINSPLKLIVLIISLCFTSTLSTANSGIRGNDLPLVALPDCNTEEQKSNLLIVSTIDGKISVIDAVDGILKWSKPITSEPLLSSTISDFIVNNKGEIVRILPSLDGNLFLHDGKTIKRTQFSTDKLLKNSMKFSENVLLVGGQENQVIGLNLKDGSLIYQCGFNGCSQVDNITFGDVILLKKTSQSVRAVNTLSGKEEWHFTVNDPRLLNIENQNCHTSTESSYKFFNDFKVIVPSGYVHSSVYQNDEYSIKRLHKEWNIKFNSPIVNMWHYEDGKLTQVNLFARQTVDIESMGVKTNHELADPDFYIGSFENQLYIQQSNKASEENLLEHHENPINDNLSEQNTAIVQVEWKQPPTESKEKSLPKKFEVSTTSTFPFWTFNKFNSTGYYIFKLNQSIESNKCERVTAEEEEVEAESGLEIITVIAYRSLSSYWKEITVICLLSWVVLNFFTSMLKRFALKFIKMGSRSDSHVTINATLASETTENMKYVNLTSQPEGSQSSIPNAIQDNIAKQQRESNTYNSRYLQDFEPIRLLGKGGFGLVFESKHKIDESHYAVKRVSIPAQKEKRDRFMREIRALSKLEHSSIVRYYHSWIEEPPAGWQEEQDKFLNFIQMGENVTEFTENADSVFSSEINDDRSQPINRINNGYLSNDSLEIIFEDDGDNNNECIQSRSKQVSLFNEDEDSDEFEEDYENEDKNKDEDISVSKQSDSRRYYANLNESTNNGMCEMKNTSVHWDKSLMELRSNERRLDSRTKNMYTPKIFVYIVMQLCKKETLKDWLIENEIRDKCKVLTIFTQIIDAVHYVHSNQLIHRDLKPSNIYFSMDGLVKVGDFGLVTTTLDEHAEISVNSCKTKKKLSKHTNDVGTILYMSPEQVKKGPYDHKVDIFSMGIILYELLEAFGTETERIITLEGVRNKKFPSHFVERHPMESQVLHKLLSFKPSERPEAHDLLNQDAFSCIIRRPK